MNVGKIYSGDNVRNWCRHEPITLSDHLCLPIILKEIQGEKNLQGGTLLDAGCGEGFFTRQLAPFFKNVIGVGSSQEMIALAEQQKNAENLSYFVSDLCQINLPNETVGVVVAVSSLHYLKNVVESEKAFREFHRILESKGKLLFSVVHPCFNTLPDEPPKNYFGNELYFGKMIGSDGRILKMGAYQHKISDYINQLVQCGFKIEKVFEPEVSISLLQKHLLFFKRNQNYPQFLLIKSKKV